MPPTSAAVAAAPNSTAPTNAQAVDAIRPMAAITMPWTAVAVRTCAIRFHRPRRTISRPVTAPTPNSATSVPNPIGPRPGRCGRTHPEREQRAQPQRDHRDARQDPADDLQPEPVDEPALPPALAGGERFPGAWAEVRDGADEEVGHQVRRRVQPEHQDVAPVALPAEAVRRPQQQPEHPGADRDHAVGGGHRDAVGQFQGAGVVLLAVPAFPSPAGPADRGRGSRRPGRAGTPGRRPRWRTPRSTPTTARAGRGSSTAIPTRIRSDFIITLRRRHRVTIRAATGAPTA